MSRLALRTAAKVMNRCPACGDRSPKELVESETRTNWKMFWLLLLFTAGLGLLYVPLWHGSHLQAFCPGCEVPFRV